MNDDLDTKKQFAALMLGLYKAFGKEPDKTVSALFFNGLSYLTIEDATHVITLAITTGDKFPTIHDLRRYVSQIPARNAPKIEYKPKYGTSLADDANKLIQAALDGKLSNENLIEGMMVMDKQYSGIGWGEQAASLAAYYSRGEREANLPHYQDF